MTEKDEIEASSPQADNVETSAPLETAEAPETTEPEGTERFQKRIDTIVGQRNEAQRENDDLRRQIDASKQVEVPVTDASEPTLEQFDFDDAKFQSALIDHRVEKGVAKGINAQIQAQSHAAQIAQSATLTHAYNQRAAEFSAQTPDFVEVVSGLQLSQNAQDAIKSLDLGPQTAYAIGKDLALSAEINRLDPVRAAVRIGEIAQTVRTNSVTNKISSAPDPITPPGGQGTALKSSELDKLSLDEFMKHEGVVKTSF